MKTKQYAIALSFALMFGTVAMQAQTTRRGATQERKESTPASRTHTNTASTQKAKTVQPERNVQKPQASPARQVDRQRMAEPTRQVQKPQASPARQVDRQRIAEPTRQVHKPQAAPARQVERQRTTQQPGKPVSISTPVNPKSTYRKANSTVYVDPNRAGHARANKYSSQRYYGGNHYHYAYPTRNVKFHYHHDTYVHNYHVLYYPTYRNIYWTRDMYRDYRVWYPGYTWSYNYGYAIQTISVFDAKYNLGEVAMVYGRVYATWYNQETDDYLLFFGGDYPYQQFTVVIPGKVARRFSWRPERYFLGEHMTATGLITTFDGIPEIVVKNKRQLGLY